MSLGSALIGVLKTLKAELVCEQFDLDQSGSQLSTFPVACPWYVCGGVWAETEWD